MIKLNQLLQQRIFYKPFAQKRVLLTLLVLVIWGFFLWRALYVFDPANNAYMSYNSDSAIPVMMSNDGRPITVFHLYYYAADRWGGWPFLLTRLVRYLTGYRWSVQSLFRLQAVWVFIGVLVIARLSRRDRFAVALIYLLTLFLHNQTRHLLFDLSQVYGWQMTPLFLSWYSLRRFFENYVRASGDDTPGWKLLMWGFLTNWFAYFAIWSSIASAPFLVFLFCAEATRIYLKTGGKGNGRKLRRGYIYGFILIALAMLTEFLQKWNYHRYSQKYFGEDFKTHFALDRGYLAENLKIHLHHLGEFSWLPFYVLPAIAILCFAGSYLYARLKKRGDLLEEMRAIVHNDTAILIVETYGIAAINLFLVIITNHVRLNDYDDRFLTITHLFAPVSGMLTLFLMFDFVARSLRSRAYARPALILAGLIFLTLKSPPRVDSAYYQMITETAIALSQKSPQGVLMGGYWETYLFTTLQPTGTMTPVPFEGQGYRTPWTAEHLKRASHVVVEYRHGALKDWPQTPPEHLTQYGRSLKLIEPKWYENDTYAFALYLNESKNP
jgi:hypothetical protein